MNNELIMTCIFIGIIFALIYSVIISALNAIDQKAWKVKDYEELIATYIKPEQTYCLQHKIKTEEAITDYQKRYYNKIKLQLFFREIKEKWKIKK